MALPAYDKNKRKRTFGALPKGAYVIRILGAKEEPNKNGNGSHIKIVFDIDEGEYKGFYQSMYQADSNENKKWPNDGTFYLNIPGDGSSEFMWTNWNTFFADLEDSNNGFVFSGDVRKLKDKIIGGKFRIEQTEVNGRVYDHTKLQWTCVAEDVRAGKAGKLPNDKLISSSTGFGSATVPASDDFMEIPEGAEDENPFL